MEKITSKYETVIVTDGTFAEDAAAELFGKFKALIEANATVDEVIDWGKRKLAYPINDINEGYYTIVHYTCEHEFPAELERVLNITDGILRSITVKVEE